jgi:hypothetical protein
MFQHQPTCGAFAMDSSHARKASSTAELVSAAAGEGVREIRVAGSLVGVPTLRLAPGQSLVGEGQDAQIAFAAGIDGVELSRDNSVKALTLAVDVGRRVLFNDTSHSTLGRMELEKLQVNGVVHLLAADAVHAGHVEAHAIDVVTADARGYDRRPKGYGVEVLPGAFTLWNQHADPAVTITADLTGLSVGRAGAPVRGSGIFVGGGGDGAGRMDVSRLVTGAVFSDGGIAPGTPNRITGGVFVAHGAYVDLVRTCGVVTTYGANDMVLDNWGTVDRWIAEAKVTSHGPSGIGFVNFGAINQLDLQAPIETFGQGARGFNVYAGTVGSAEFDRTVTHADGAVGLQISQPIGTILVKRGIETFGGVGDSLVKGVVVRLFPSAFSIKPGGAVRRAEIRGGLITHGPGIEALELHGDISALLVEGGLTPGGGGFEAF